MPNLARAFAALVQMAECLGIVTEKSVASVVRGFKRDLRNLVVLGFISDKSILADMRNLIRNYVSDAYLEGLAEGGVPEGEASADDEVAIAELRQTQLDHVTAFVKAIREAKEDKAAQRDILNNRIPLWVQSIEGIAAQGLASAKANEMVVWRYGDTEHCSTCQKLNGQKHRRKWFADRNYFPRTPGADLECGGYNCQCELIPVK